MIGIWHLASRLREYLEHYTYPPKRIQDSIMREEEKTNPNVVKIVGSPLSQTRLRAL